MNHQGIAALTAAAAIALAAAACHRSGSSSDTPSIAYEKYTLGNGLEVILSEDHRLPLVAVNVWYHVGPANEAAGRTGFAHLFEHMMFQGSKHVAGDGHFRYVEAAGGSTINGTTDFDRTNYFETLPSDQLELGLWLESDRMGYLLDTVDLAKLANQQDVVRNERRQSIENRPYGLAQEQLFQTIFPPGHPYRANVIGSHADIQAAKLDDVKAFFKQYYAPNNASLAIVGDIDVAATKRLVEKYFGPLVRGADVPKARAAVPTISGDQRLVAKDRIRLPRVVMAWMSPAFFSPGDADADAAASALGGGPSSRLYKALVYEKQIAQDVSAFQQSMGLGSVFQIVATVRPGHTPGEVEAALDAELDRFRQAGPDEREVERARNTFETQMLQGLERLGGFGGAADLLNMFNHYLGDPGYLPKYLEEHRRVTPASVKAFAERYLRRDARVVQHVVAGDPDLGTPVPTPPAPNASAGAGAEAVNADAPWRATPPAAGAARAIAVPPARSFTLPNGLTVVYHVRPGAATVTGRLALKTGSDMNPPDRPGLVNFAASMLSQGTTSRDALTLADDLAQLGASLNATSTKDQASVTVASLARNFAAALDIAADVALRPTFPQADVERQRASRLASLAAARQNPATVATSAATLALYGPAHPYAYMELGTEEAAKATSRDDLAGIWKKTFVPANAALVVAGPMDEAALRPLVERTFGGWPSGPAVAPAAAAPVTTDSRVVIVDVPKAPQTQLVVTSLGAPRSAPDYPAILTMNTVLGGLFSSRINLNLREEHGYTYGASSQFLFRKTPGPFWVTTGVRTDVTAPAASEILEEIRRMASSPLTQEELTLARDAIVRSLPSDFETSGSTVATLSDLVVYGLGLDYYSKFPSAIAAVGIPDVQAAARKYLAPGPFIVVAVGDRAAIEPGLRKLNLGELEIEQQR